MAKRRVVITGLGVVTSIGIGKGEFWNSNLEGSSGVDLITCFDTENYPSKIASQVKEFDPLKFMSLDFVDRTDRFSQLGLGAGKLALEDSHLNLNKEDKSRIGVVIGSGLGEGASCLVLEELNHAKKRNAKIYAEIIGYSCNCGAYHLVMPRQDAKDAARCMKDALESAEVSIKEIDYINAHGTGTFQNDRIETKAIKEVFGDYAYKIPINSTKSMIGHTIGAAGAIEAVVCCLAIENQIIPPTINYQYPDPECDLDYVPNKARKEEVQIALSNSFGFGSNNACLVLRRYDG